MIEWINNIFGIENDVSVPIVISLIVFVTGGIVAYFFQKIKEYQQRSQLRKTFLLLVDQTATDLKRKEENILDFYPTLKIEHYGRWSLTNSPISYLDTFFELDFTEIYSAFRKKFFWSCDRELKEKAFHKIWALLRNLKFVESQIEPNLNTMVSKFNEYHNQYNSSLNLYRKFFDDIIRDTNGKELPKKLAQFITDQDKLWHAWQQLDETERVKHFVTYNQVVKPVIELVRQNTHLPLTKEIDVDLLDCAHQFIQMDTLLKNYHEQFRIHYMAYRRSRRSLRRTIKILQ